MLRRLGTYLHFVAEVDRHGATIVIVLNASNVRIIWI